MIKDKIDRLMHIVSDENLKKIVSEQKLTFYFGIDPTGKGIHIGHLIVMKLALELLKRGHSLIVLVGGFTGQIGDPTGKIESRKALEKADIQNYSEGILCDIKEFFSSYTDVTYVNNRDWLDGMTLAKYAQIAQKISINNKLGMETYASRLKNHQALTGLEFLYSDLQFIDFYYLHEKYGCSLQIGGQDQCGNILFGVRHLKHFTDKPSYGICTPLLVNQGKKIGKSESGTKFLRDYVGFYNFFLSLPDVMTDQIAYLLDIESLESHPMEKKKHIISQIYQLCFHENAKEYFLEAQERNNKMFYGSVNEVDENYFVSAPYGNISTICLACKMLSSKSEFNRLLAGRGLYINSEPLTEDYAPAPGEKLKISIGKNTHYYIRIQ